MKLLVAIVSAWLVANVCKVISTSIRTKVVDWQVVFFAGGMPSVHTTLVTALVTSLALSEGLTAVTVASIVFASLFVYDAMTLRRAVAEHNAILRWVHTHLNVQVAKSLERKGGIGHTPLEVVAGIVIGVLVPLLVYA
ncbi:MAG: divergent PAP2 family protein [Candidatus Woesearchaeota archaeon]|nr:divergent PAP2 family protein [Candidatus Woesearchaeota archaeon]